MDGRTVGLLVGAVGGTAFVVFNAPRLPAPFGLVLGVVAVLDLVGLVAVLLRRRRAVGGPDGSGPAMYGRGYRVIVVVEAVAIVGGAIVLGRLGLAQAVLPWVAFVVGAHFVALGRVWRQTSLLAVGVVVALCGIAGFALAVARADDVAIALVGGILPGVALLAGTWWTATRTDRAVADHGLAAP